MRSTRSCFWLSCLCLLPSAYLSAGEISGKVEQVAGEAVTISVPADVRIAAGDRFEIVVDVPDVGTAQVASGQVAAVVGKLVMGKIVNATGKVAVGQKVRFISTQTSPSPPPQPVPPSSPTSKPLPVVIASYVSAQNATEAKLEGKRGAVIERTLPGSSGDALLPGDIVLAIDGRIVGQPSSFYRRVGKYLGKNVVLDIARKNARLQQSVALTPNPDAIRQLEKLAEGGDVSAQRTLAYHKLFGIGMDVNKAESASWFRKAAEAGDGLAQLELSIAYVEGREVEKSDVKAYTWCRRAASKDFPEGQSQLAWMLSYGRGVPANVSKARALFTKAADRGDARAYLAIGICHNFGLDELPKDPVEAARWYRKAADAGHPKAMSNLGYSATAANDYAEARHWLRMAADHDDPRGMQGLAELYANGRGVPQDYAEAARWHRLAADLGNKFAQFSLAQLYEKGQGVPKDREQAIIWYRESAAQGHEPARQALNNLGVAWKVPAAGPGDEGSGFREVHVMRGHRSAAFMVAVTPDGEHALTTGIDGTLRTWNLKSGEEVSRIQAHRDWAVGLAISPDGSRAFTSGNDATVRLWNLETGKEVRRFKGHTKSVWSVMYSADGTQLLTGSHDNTVRLWNVITGKEVRRFDCEGDIWTACLSPDGEQVLSGEKNAKAAQLWNAETGEQHQTLPGNTVAAAFSPDGSLVLTGGWDGPLSLWDARTGKGLRKLEGHRVGVRTVAFSPDGKRAVTAGYDLTVRLWDIETGKQLARYDWQPAEGPELPSVKDYMLFGTAFTPDGEYVVAAGADGTVRLLKIDLRAEAPSVSDLQKLQGTWVCVTALKDGKPMDAYVGGRAVIKGNDLAWQFPRKPPSYRKEKNKFRIDPTKDPKHFDWWQADKSAAEADLRLYSVEGDTFRFATSLDKKTRPLAFASAQLQFTLKRVYEEPDSQPDEALDSRLPRVDRIAVLNVGIFRADTLETRDEPRSVTGVHEIVGKLHHVEDTTTVPNVNGQRFGFHYTVSGAPQGAKVTLKQVVIYPKKGFRSGRTGKLSYRDEVPYELTLGGGPFYCGFHLGANDKGVVGKWTFQLWFEDRMLAEQEFKLVSSSTRKGRGR